MENGKSVFEKRGPNEEGKPKKCRFLIDRICSVKDLTHDPDGGLKKCGYLEVDTILKTPMAPLPRGYARSESSR